ncbi:hypothetical protein FB107DRAFT_273407 [Schizophyllum commune]
MFNLVFLSSALALAGSAAAQSYYAAAKIYGADGVETSPCQCDNTPVGGAAFARGIRQELGKDLCCAKVTVNSGGNSIQTVFKDICDSCDSHNIALETEAWTSLTNMTEDGSLNVFWTVQE